MHSNRIFDGLDVEQHSVDQSHLPTKNDVRDYVRRCVYGPDGRKLTPTQRLVMNVLADKYNIKKGYAWPSHKYLCEMVGCDERYLRRLIRQLQDQGVLLVVGRERGGKPTSNAYIFAELVDISDLNIEGAVERIKTIPSSVTPVKGDGDVLPPAGGEHDPHEEGKHYPLGEGSIYLLHSVEPELEPRVRTIRAQKRAQASRDVARAHDGNELTSHAIPTNYVPDRWYQGEALAHALYVTINPEIAVRYSGRLNRSEEQRLKDVTREIASEYPSGLGQDDLLALVQRCLASDDRLKEIA